ncbi:MULTISPECIES: hypothetical protein [Bradyrhizobium]|uniref:hypothetical protein n=1 Tax=Bradyrhizobium TaxID=374 RepID=UPI001EDC0518|nr:hypothetical protein [Bradyrhizobium zhengyangense]MCG2641084.1 hypothetical protein [Bradyrhizobium zhengyangense]
MPKTRRPITLICPFIVACIVVDLPAWQAAGQAGPTIAVSASVPNELNPPFVQGPPSTGGAPAASPEQASAFAWQEFIALNWPAGPQTGEPGQREAPSSTCKFGDPSPDCKLLVWQTMRGKAEIFPGDSNPPHGYSGSTAATSWGYDSLPAYNYVLPVLACDSRQSNDPTPWINLDETDQITLDNMYAGVVNPSSSPGNSSPQLIRFLAKANRSQYVYVAGNSDPNNFMNQWWNQIPPDVVAATKAYLAKNEASPTAGSKTLVSLPDGTIEVKAGWRPLNNAEIGSGRFQTQTVRFYENGSGGPCYRDASWGLVALHIIQKTPSAPYFIYATFEQADNILTADGKPIEDVDGNIQQPEPATATTPQVCLVDPQPPMSSPPPVELTSKLGTVILTSDPATCKPAPTASYCGSPGSQLYYRNATFPPTNNQPSDGNICVNKRDNAIPPYAIAANAQAHAAITAYLKQNNFTTAPALYYKLVNVQYFPYDKIPNPNLPNGSLYTAQPPYAATNPAASSYYQANIVVETNRSLQFFAGGLSPNISTEWNQDGSPHKNSYYGGKFYNMGGCMGCHGSQGQNPAGSAGDFSVILARGSVTLPEVPAVETSKGLTNVRRNRRLSR